MKTFLLAIILCVLTTMGFAQSVTLEPGKSIFNQNTTESVEIKSTSVFPLKIRSTQPAVGLPFYSDTNTFRGQIQGGIGGIIYSVPANHSHGFWTKNLQRMIVDSVGNVGIGNSTPKYLLDIFSDKDTAININSQRAKIALVFSDVGKIETEKFNFLNTSVKNFRLQSEGSFRLLSKSNTLFQLDKNGVIYTPILIENTGRVLINANEASELISYNNAKADLDVNGTLRSTELDFAETISTERRPVYADKDGILRVENSSNHYMSYNFTSVQAQNYDDQIIRGSGFAWFNTTTSPKTLYLPVNLPDGVKVTNVRMYLLDNSASNLSFTFNKNTHVTNTFTSIATAQSSTNTVGIFSINNNANETIDNANNSYYVNISSSGNWTGNTLQFHSLVITYQYQ
jgi:hypothetical protein